MKSYSHFMNKISSEDIFEGLLGHGLFSEKLPPIFSSESFYKYCRENPKAFPEDRACPYVFYESMRNTNVPRQLGIPNPMAYQQLCRCISANWSKIQNHFEKATCNDTHIVSRIHLRKMNNTKILYRMNYDNWKTDGNPIQDLLIGHRYVVHADIATCFPSIYTHTIPWALVGKETAKKNTHCRGKNKTWYNEIDLYARNCRNNETHGILIGPHASNLISEIILTCIDSELTPKWKYIRHIDDYTCYVTTHDEAQRFLAELSDELRKYDLLLNHKKTLISELPQATAEEWLHKIGHPALYYNNGILDFIGARSYLEHAIEVMQESGKNSAVLNYAIKALPYDKTSANARDYCIKTAFHLCLLYPYLLQIMDEFVFERFKVQRDEIKRLADLAYEWNKEAKNYDGVCYSIFFALKHKFQLGKIKAQDAIDSDSCVFRLLAFLYFAINKDVAEKTRLKDFALKLSGNDDDFGRNWLFVYEALPAKELSEEWQKIKVAGVSFLKNDYLV